MRKKLVAVGVASTVLLGTAGVAFAEGPTTSAPERDCNKDPWPTYVQGQPDGFEAGAALGDYIWHDRDGWHVRVTHRGNERVTFTGVVSADTAMRDHRVRDERNDRLVKSADGKSFAFEFQNYGYVDGVDFKTDCASTLRFSLKVDGRDVPLRAIRLGDQNANPDSDPFAVTR